MAKSNRIYNPAYRKRKAYYTATIVFLSYYWLSLKAKLFGQSYYQKRLPHLHEKNADRIKYRIQELQGLFIKFGQLISNLSNVLPLAFREPLESLQDSVEAKDFKELQSTIQKELGRSYDKIFTDFEATPIAAASIGQVHRATLDGKEVVVKVQHANIETIAAADLAIIKNLVKLHAFFMDMEGLDHTYDQVSLMINEELDYKQEACSMQEISSALSAIPSIRVKVPQVFEEYSTKKILVSEYCSGSKVSNIDQLETWNLDKEDIAKRIIELYCHMVLINGFYHADPHPGNILVNQQGEIVLLDFGATARLSVETREAIPELIEAIVKNDTQETILALRKLGFIGSDKDSKRFVEKLIGIFREFLEKEVEFDGLNFQNVKLQSGIGSLTTLLMNVDLRDISKNIRIPKEYILLNRTTVLLLGNTFNLAPNLNTLTVVRPFVKKHLMEQNEDFISAIVNAFKNQVTTAVSLPKELSNFLKKSRPEELEYELKETNYLLRKIYKLLKVFFFTLLIGAIVLVVLNYQLSAIAIGSLLFFTSVLLYSLLKTMLTSSK